MKKVNVWQIGYTTIKDWILRNRENAQCRPMGYVLIADDENEDDAWHLLNWGCWSWDGEKKVKPKVVFSPLDYCNSDVILQVEGTNVYMCADSIGWTEKQSLESAVAHVKKRSHWPFHDVKCVGGSFFEKDGKAYMEKNNGEFVEVTW